MSKDCLFLAESREMEGMMRYCLNENAYRLTIECLLIMKIAIMTSLLISTKSLKNGRKKMELNRALEILEYNKAMLTCDMSISRDPEHQDVSPDYYGKDAEDLYNAIVCVEKYIKNAIPIDWINKWVITNNVGAGRTIDRLLEDWEKENARD